MAQDTHGNGTVGQRAGRGSNLPPLMFSLRDTTLRAKHVSMQASGRRTEINLLPPGNSEAACLPAMLIFATLSSDDE